MKLTLLAVIAFVAPSCYEATYVAPFQDGCTKDGRYFAIGRFADPTNRCTTCECFTGGRFQCQREVCPALSCPVNQRFYPLTSCCQRCHGVPHLPSSASSSDHDTSKSSKSSKRSSKSSQSSKRSSKSSKSSKHSSKSSKKSKKSGSKRSKKSGKGKKSKKYGK